MSGNSPCSVGETAEAAIGLTANNRRLDISSSKGKAELKSGRRGSSTPKSEFTRVFNSEEGAPFTGKSKSARFNSLVEKYARPSKKDKERLNLYYVPTATPHSKTGLYLEYDYSNERLWLSHIDDGRLVWYDQDDMDSGFEKMLYQYYIEAEVLKMSDSTYFDFSSAWKLGYRHGKLTPLNLFEMIQKGWMEIHLRAHICNEAMCYPNCIRYRRTGELGNVRDHGTAIRTVRRHVSDIFTEILLDS
jgi:hypothetical protein